MAPQSVESVEDAARIRHVLHFNLVAGQIVGKEDDRADAAHKVLLEERLATLNVFNRANMERIRLLVEDSMGREEGGCARIIGVDAQFVVDSKDGANPSRRRLAKSKG